MPDPKEPPTDWSRREELLVAANDLVPHLVSVVGADRRYLHINQAYLDWYHAERSDIIGRTVEEVIGTAAWEIASPHVHATLEGAASSFVTRLVSPEGRSRLVLARLRPVRDRSGRIYAYSVYAEDITEHTAVRDALVATERLYRSLFEGMQQGFLVLSPDDTGSDYVVREFNPAMARLAATPDAEVVGKVLRTFLPDAEDHQAWVERLDRVRHTGEVAIGDYSVPRSTRVWQFYMFPAPNDRVALLVVDVTDRRAHERAMAESQRMESLGRVVEGVARDFNNLIAAISSSLAALYLGTSSGESSSRRLLTNIEAAVNRATSLIGQLLTYAGRGAVERRIVELDGIFDSMSELLRVTVGRNVSLDVRVSPRRVAVDVDEGQIRQVILNLVLNAAEALAGRPGVITVTGTVEDLAGQEPWLGGEVLAPGRYARLEVRDSGSGMTSEVLSKVFEPFFSTRGPGRGVGLSTSRGIVKAHGGAFQVSSTPGRGSCFAVYLPVVSNEDRRRPEVGASILFVDDDELVRGGVPPLLEALGYTVRAVESVGEALGELSEVPAKYRAILLSAGMPGADVAGVAQLRALCGGLPVILMCGGPSGEGRSAFPGVEMLPKPFDVATLRRVLERVLGP